MTHVTREREVKYCSTVSLTLTSAGERPSSTVEINDSSFEPLPFLRMKDTGGHAAQRGVVHVHGGAGASLDHLHPGHHPVQQVYAMTQAQSMSHVTLEKKKHKHTMGQNVPSVTFVCYGFMKPCVSAVNDE